MKTKNLSGFIAYYRVSTDKQGASGLGLDAQRTAVSRYVEGKGALLASSPKSNPAKAI